MTDDGYGQNRPYDALNVRGLTGKRDYVRGLEQRRDEEALSLLVECLCDESWYLRELAEEALLRIGDPATVVLIPLIEQGLWFTRGSAARILGKLAHRPAVPALLRIADDLNTTVVESSREALIAIGRGRGVFSIAKALHALPVEVRRIRLDELAERDRPLAEAVERRLRNHELMAIEGNDFESDDSPMVRVSEEGLEWEVLTGPAPTSPRTDASEGEGGEHRAP